jgi:Flp pilus assembly protein TadG
MNERISERQRGQSIVIVAGALVVLVMFVAITVDVTDAYYHRRIAQNGADGAALAGAGELGHQINDQVFNDTAIKILMNDYGERNGIHDTNGILADFTNNNVEGYYLDQAGQRITGTVVGGGYVPVGAWGIEAVTYITAPTWFGGVFGMDGYPIGAEAAVVLAESCGVGCVIPVATHTDTLKYVADDDEDLAPCINIWNGVGPGNFGWLNWDWQISLQEYDTGFIRPTGQYSVPVDCQGDECSSRCLTDNLDPENACNSGFVTVGDWAAGSSGVSNDIKPRQHLQYYIGFPEWTDVKHQDDCPVDLNDNQCPPQSPFHEVTVVVYGPTITGTNWMGQVIGASGVITDGSGCGKVEGNSGDLATDMQGQFYNVVGFARMRLLGYQLSQGESWDPWISPTECYTDPAGLSAGVYGEPPNDGNRLTAIFLGWADGIAGECEAIGTTYGLQITK